LIDFFFLHLLAGVLALAVDFEQLGWVEFGRLEDLDFADEDVLERVDALAHLFYCFADALGDELGDEVLELGMGGLAGHDVDHLASDGDDLRGLCVRGFALLVGAALGETDGEHAEAVAVGGVDVDLGLDECLPLANERAQLVGGEIHAVEVGECLVGLDVLDSQADLAESLILVLLQVGQRDGEDTSAQRVGAQLGALSAVDWGLANVAVGELGWSANVVPLLLDERVDDLLLLALLLSELLVFANSHVVIK